MVSFIGQQLVDVATGTDKPKATNNNHHHLLGLCNVCWAFYIQYVSFKPYNNLHARCFADETTKAKRGKIKLPKVTDPRSGRADFSAWSHTLRLDSSFLGMILLLFLLLFVNFLLEPTHSPGDKIQTSY